MEFIRIFKMWSAYFYEKDIQYTYSNESSKC